MFPQKVPKGEQPDKTVYTIYHCHTTPEPIVWYNRSDCYRILSIDPGKKNFCFRIEFRDLIKRSITMEAYEKIDLIGDQTENKTNRTDMIFRNVMLLLDRYIGLIMQCHLVIIERQLQINYKMVRFSQHLITYLMLKLQNNEVKTVIMEVNPQLKTQQFGVKGLGKRETKQWAIQKADELLRSRGDINSLNIIKKAKSKKDDLSDTVVQIEAVFKCFKLPITEDYYKIQTTNVVPMTQTQLFNTNNSIGYTLANTGGNIIQNLQIDLRNISIEHPSINHPMAAPIVQPVSQVPDFDLSKLKVKI